ncbi:potassium-transporting ATPase subunit KdpC [Paenibacillus sp. UNC499MF]|uniref:potassium-transporting ATPase subunit KdpC n=1 Tax=Paenibacillus sp. UNC499MF TaxID=1502751 RepID=UPI0008A016C2|nr:potassium-transporting ATPase subunit KdpC [Paenibacillus sp. UNC499MF]SEG69657.1 K+-transporting ATPase ATPase C chain [Paenibacillus sp. UNC499MF]
MNPGTSVPKENGEWNGSVLSIAVRISILFIVLCGIIYPLVSTGLAQVIFPKQANGSVIKNEQGDIVGSELIGQLFTDPKYFHGRVSSIEYKAEASGSNNYAPSKPELVKRTQESIDTWKKENPDVPVNQVPISLLTNSSSGLDPHITPESAEVQIPRIAQVTGVSTAQLQELVKKHTAGRDLGVFGEPRVNVLELNLDLKKAAGK